MKKTLFLAFSAAIVIFSIISICCAPIINVVLVESYGWKTLNCKKESDEYKYWKDHSGTDDYLKGQKKVINQCNRHKAMYGLEYSSLILDVVLGFICVILGLLHYFDVAKPFEKITGIIGLATGVIGFVLTLVYICYSGYIFTNELAPDSYDNGLSFSGSSSFPTIDDVLIKLNGKGAFAEKDGDGYKCLYYKKDKVNSIFAKYSDLGKKQYNYQKKRHYPEDNSKYSGCQGSCTGCLSNEFVTSSVSSTCDYLYSSTIPDEFVNKYLFDMWVTSIIFSCFIFVCAIGLAIFGFLLFKNSDGSGL
jgi:hypothetical protein